MACGVDVGVCSEVELCCDGNVEACEELWRFGVDVVCVNVQLYSGVQGMDLRSCGLGALVYCQYILLFNSWAKKSIYDTHVLAQVLLCHQKLRTQVVFCNYFMVDDCKRADTCQDQVFGNLIGKSFSSNQEDIRRLYPRVARRRSAI